MSTEPSKFDRLPKTLRGLREFNAAKGILLFLIGALLYVGHTAFIPVALAMLAGLILSSPVEALFRLGLPRGVGAVLILVAALAAVGGLVALIWTPSQEWYASAPHTLSVIQRKFTPVARLMSHIEQLTDRAGKVGAPNPPEPTAVAAPQESTSRILLSTVRDAAIGLATFVIITLFLLAGGPPMVARMTAAFFDHLKAHHVQGYIDKVRAEVGHFYVITAFINLGLGIATTLVMMAWGMPTPYLWGAVAALLNFIPYAGATTTLIVLTLVAIVSFDGLGTRGRRCLELLGPGRGRRPDRAAAAGGSQAGCEPPADLPRLVVWRRILGSCRRDTRHAHPCGVEGDRRKCDPW